MSPGPFCSGKLAYGHSRKILHNFARNLTFLRLCYGNSKCPQCFGLCRHGFFNQRIHLLFFCHPILSLCVRSIPNFKYNELKADALIALMGSTWDSMVSESIVRPSLASNSAHAAFTPRPLLSDSERKKLKLAGGCFRCQQTPSSPDWVPHGSRNCPGDKSKGIPPAPPRNPTHIAAFLHENTNTVTPVPHPNVAAILPSSFVLQGDEWDEDSDSDNSNSDE